MSDSCFPQVTWDQVDHGTESLTFSVQPRSIPPPETECRRKKSCQATGLPGAEPLHLYQPQGRGVQEHPQMAIRHVWRWSTLYVIVELKIKTMRSPARLLKWPPSIITILSAHLQQYLFTLQCDQSAEVFWSCRTETMYPLGNDAASPLLQPLASTSLLSVSMYLTTFVNSHRRIRIVCVLRGLIYSTL